MSKASTWILSYMQHISFAECFEDQSWLATGFVNWTRHSHVSSSAVYTLQWAEVANRDILPGPAWSLWEEITEKWCDGRGFTKPCFSSCNSVKSYVTPWHWASGYINNYAKCTLLMNRQRMIKGCGIGNPSTQFSRTTQLPLTFLHLLMSTFTWHFVSYLYLSRRHLQLRASWPGAHHICM